ncbi:MAG: asparagine--tRNA ligase, partial [Kiritimatiellae bacterium]|nr:asparagine--tRNA ligase [Kiritimatiellia bacterium]
MKRTKIQNLLKNGVPGGRVTVAGWVRTRRDAKGFSFLELNDGSCLANLQVIADATLPGFDETVLRLYPGASAVVDGVLAASQGKGQSVELRAESVRVLGLSDPLAYPLGKQRIGFERLRELPHLRARTNSFGAVARVRSALAAAVHRFFRERGFVYVHTPLITARDCEGAGEMFQVSVPGNPDFFGARAAL